MKTCSVEGCDRKYHGNGFCAKHNSQMYYFGKILNRTTHDPNEFIVDGDICWVILYDIKCIETARAKFYTKYYEQIKDSKLKWHLDELGYVKTDWIDKNGQKQYTFLHELIIQLSEQAIQPGEEIDHKDRDKLNCLDDNLRICTRMDNVRNRSRQYNNTSGYIGVIWHKTSKKWQARINVNHKRLYLGFFDIIEDAARAYNAAAIKYFDEFAVLNDV